MDCFRCDIGGDVISFVQRMEGITFREAVERLGDNEIKHASSVNSNKPAPRGDRSGEAKRQTPEERACLRAAVEFYRNCLLSEPEPLGYAFRRGVSRATLDRLHVGYCSGAGLVDYLRWQHLPRRAARSAGLMGRDGTEWMAGRVVVPEMRGGDPIWLIGRAWDPPEAEPKYLCLAGPKPLLGWERACGHEEVYCVEGVFDWLVLNQWRLPAVALVGAHARPAVREALSGFRRLYLVLDSDDAGKQGAARLAAELGARALRVNLPGVKDVADLALRPNGRCVLRAAVDASHTGGEPV